MTAEAADANPHLGSASHSSGGAMPDAVRSKPHQAIIAALSVQ